MEIREKKRRQDKKEGEGGGKKEGEERGGKDRWATCPFMGDVDNAEDSPVPAGGQGLT